MNATEIRTKATEILHELYVKKCDEGILWVIENCELSPMSYRRAIWNMKEAGWFENAKGFIMGRATGCFEGDLMGVDTSS